MSGDALAAFRAYDFDTSPEWKKYLNKVEITSTAHNAMLKLKAKWYNRNVDEALDVAKAVEACRSTATACAEELPSSRAGTRRPGSVTMTNGKTYGPEVMRELMSADEGVIQAIAQHKLEAWLRGQSGGGEPLGTGPAAHVVLNNLLSRRVKPTDAEYAVEVLVKVGMDPNQHMPNAIKSAMAPATMGQMALGRPALLKKMVELGLLVNQRQVNTGGTLLDIIGKMCAMGGVQTPEGKVGVPVLLKSAQVLLDAGANPDLPDDLGSPPLHYALQEAARTGQVELVRLLYPVSNTAEYLDADVADVCADLRRPLSDLVSELNRISKDLPAAGSDDPHSKSPAVRRAASILLAAHNKVRKWDDLLDLSPTFHLPQLIDLINTAAHFLSMAGSSLSGAGRDPNRQSQRVHVQPTNAPVPAKTLKRFLALFHASPHHPGYQLLMHWCVPMREAVVTVRASLPSLPKGLRTYVEWLKLHKRPKEQPCFQSAENMARAVSWVIMCNKLPGNSPVLSHPAFFNDLIVFGHHRDLADVIEMGNGFPIMQWATLCKDGRVAEEMLLQAPSRPKFLKALQAPVQKVVKAASTTGQLDLRTNQLCTQVIHALAYIGSVALATPGERGARLWEAMLTVCRHPLWGNVAELVALKELPPKVVEWASKDPSNVPVLGDFRSAHADATKLLAAIKVPDVPSAAAATDGAPAGAEEGSDTSHATALSNALLEKLKELVMSPGEEADEGSPEWNDLMNTLREQAAAKGVAFKDYLDRVGFQTGEHFRTALSEGALGHQVKRDLKDVFKADKACWNCGGSKAKSSKALLVCGKCKSARYCSADCQRAHWRNGHKAFCSATQDPRPVFVAGQ